MMAIHNIGNSKLGIRASIYSQVFVTRTDINLPAINGCPIHIRVVSVIGGIAVGKDDGGKSPSPWEVTKSAMLSERD